MAVHVTFYQNEDGPMDRPPMVSVDVWPADKPTLRERIAFRQFVFSVRRIQKVAKLPFE